MHDPALSFLEALWAGAEGFAEIRAISREKKIERGFFRWPHERAGLVAFAAPLRQAFNIYFGACLRCSKAGTADQVLRADGFWCDIDWKATPKDQAEKRLAESPVRPSAVIESGGGLHLWWFLREPVMGEDLRKLRTWNLRLAAWFDADKNACDPARIMRLPGTLNHKYAQSVAARIRDLAPERRYNLMDFDFLPELATGAAPERSLPQLLPKIVAEGQGRNSMLTSLAGSLRRRGMEPDEIREMLDVANATRCAPPLGEGEIRSIAESIGRYAPGEVPATRSAQAAHSVPEEPRREDIIVMTPPVTAKALIAQELPEIDYALWPLLSSGSTTLLQGEPKGGKSCFALYCAISTAIGLWTSERWIVQRPRKTLFVTWEDGARRVKTRLTQYLAGMGIVDDAPENLLIYSHVDAPEIRLETLAGRARLRWLVETHGAEVVVLDTLSYLHAVAENEKEAMQPVMDAIKAAARDFHAAIMFVHHVAKAGGQDKRSVVYRSRGSSVIPASADVILDWGQRVDDTTLCHLVSKDDDADEFNICYKPNPGKATVEWRLEDAEANSRKHATRLEVLAAVLEYCKTSTEGITRAQASAIMPKLEHRTIRYHLDRLAQDGSLESRKGPKGARVYVPVEA